MEVGAVITIVVMGFIAVFGVTREVKENVIDPHNERIEILEKKVSDLENKK